MTAKPEIKSRLDFSSPEAWQAYVKANVPPQERPYALTLGQIMLYLEFYKVRKQLVPAEFTEELERIEGLIEPERTGALKALNGVIFADMSRFVINGSPSHVRRAIKESPRELVEKLLSYIGKENPMFAIWAAYKRVQREQTAVPTWEEYIRDLLTERSAGELEFALLMGQLGELLYQFRDKNLPLPQLSFQRICFLHHEREGPERNLHARALVHELLEAMIPCTFA